MDKINEKNFCYVTFTMTTTKIIIKARVITKTIMKTKNIGKK